MSYKLSADQRKILFRRKVLLQRWLYAFISILTMIPIVYLTIKQIRYMKYENNEFGICLLIFIHSGCVTFSMISTAMFCRVADGLLTILTILLLFAYTGVHFYIRFLLARHQFDDDFTTITLRLGFVLIVLIILLPWTGIINYLNRIANRTETICSRTIVCSWLLNLDTILIVSLLTLNIRSKADFGRDQLILLSIGIPLVFLWFIIGKVLVNKKSRHWFVWTGFYLLALFHICHLSYTTYWSIHEYHLLSNKNEMNLIPLLMITFICGSTSVVIHFLTIITSVSLIKD